MSKWITAIVLMVTNISVFTHEGHHHFTPMDHVMEIVLFGATLGLGVYFLRKKLLKRDI